MSKLIMSWEILIYAKLRSIHFKRLRKVKIFILFRTVGYGYVTKIKPAKKLLEEQKEQLGLKK